MEQERRGDTNHSQVWPNCDWEESVIKIERRDENSSESLYGNVCVEFSSVQPTHRAHLRGTSDDCALIFFSARHVTNNREKKVPHLSLSYPKHRRQLSPLRLVVNYVLRYETCRTSFIFSPFPKQLPPKPSLQMQHNENQNHRPVYQLQTHARQPNVQHVAACSFNHSLCAKHRPANAAHFILSPFLIIIDLWFHKATCFHGLDQRIDWSRRTGPAATDPGTFI